MSTFGSARRQDGYAPEHDPRATRRTSRRPCCEGRVTSGSPIWSTTSSPSSRTLTWSMAGTTLKAPVTPVEVSGDRSDSDLLGPVQRAGSDQARARPVPLLRWRLGRQLRPADSACLRRRHVFRPSRGRGRFDPLRSGPRRHRRCRQSQLEGRLHRRGSGPDRRRAPGPVPRRDSRVPPREIASRQLSGQRFGVSRPET